MAVVRENTTINGIEFIHTYSDLGMKIKRDEVLYDEAFDPIEYKDNRIYEETDIAKNQDILDENE